MLPQISSIELKEIRSSFVLQDLKQDHWALLHSGKTRFGHRYSILAENPYLILRVSGRKQVTQLSAHGQKQFNKDGWEWLGKLLKQYRNQAIQSQLPFTSGAIVAMSYNAFLSDTSPDPAKHSDADVIWAGFFKDYQIHDQLSGRCWSVHVHGPKTISKTLKWSSARLDKLKLNGVTKNAYINGVEKIRDYIRQGRIYQVNLTQQYQWTSRQDPFDIFQKLNQINPAPMSGFFKMMGQTLVSSSPERFLRRSGQKLESNPIKGTRPRFHKFDKDRAMIRELWESPKENAELAMIVDLMRNDIGQVAEIGSVQVGTARRIENYNNVFHLVAKVTAKISNEYDAIDVIRTLGPAGSITGCPKSEAIKVIEAQEKTPRGFYTGNMGYIDFNGNFDLNVMIRSLHFFEGQVQFGLGSGIVYDSDPAAEYMETLDKGATIFRVLK